MNINNISSEERKSQVNWIVEVLKEASRNERGITPKNEECLRKILENTKAWPVIDIAEIEITAFDLGKLWPESIFIQKGKVLRFQREFNPRKQSIILYKNELYDENVCLVLGYFPKNKK